ncbi:dihydroorotate dehydrogenase-like protein [Ketobacter sp.]|uniref:dihydroorotate dehydrogenase-like protein n=1 Tax=Ketobacter sp. TaxID=2083498 RepID=UPI000F1E7609|nr:dihydroorotate dehydrogenase-like protein [Ketobacter sp.]RLT98066.1 MAG: dihydroorotate dehydrogenase-like protein [Ketobacter sp.]
MADLSSVYCGLTLANPLVASASPLTAELASAKQLQAAGAGALVLPSLFEESVRHDATLLNRYADKIKSYKDALDIPVIASLNGITEGGWLDHARSLEQAGCDAIELNIYYIAANAHESSDQIERRYIDLVYKLRAQIRVPIAVKLTHQFSSVAHLVKRLEDTGANGVVLFNRFYLPDIDVESMSVTPSLQLSHSSETLLRIRWIGLLRDQVRLSLAATGGMHNLDDLLKTLLVGADAVQLCSVLFEQGIDEMARLRDQLEDWLDRKGYDGVDAIKGLMSYGKAKDPSAFERANYLQVLEQNS